jgi:hypothetical protein
MASSPKPIASGEPLRAPNGKFSSPANKNAGAKAPRSPGGEVFTASTGERPFHLITDLLRDNLAVGLGRKLGAFVFQLPRPAES